jgi:predicted enzyme related to lactoylglutathione lyase
MTQPPPPTLRTGTICYLEIPARDVRRSADFYRAAFAWRIRFGDTDRPSFDDTTGQVSGEFVRNRTPDADPGILPYIMVASAAAAAGAIVAAGGTIVLPVGQYGTEVLATFLDPAGNLRGIYQQPGLAEAEAGS